MRFHPADAGVTALTSIHDLWRGIDLNVDTTEFSVPAHGAVLLKAREQ
jgi:hypothetical protein